MTLIDAARDGYHSKVERLLNEGVDVNVQDKYGYGTESGIFKGI